MSGRNNELDVLLQDLSNARYNGGVERQESSEQMYSSSIVQQINGYHPDKKVAPDYSIGRKSREKDEVIRELETLMTEEETIIEEKQQFHLSLGSKWKDQKPRTEHEKQQAIKNLTVSSSAYSSSSEPENLDFVTHTLNADHFSRRAPVDMPLDTRVKVIRVDLHQEFEKTGIREEQMRQGYGRPHVDDIAETFVPPPAPASPPSPRRPDPICAACSRGIQGRCITAMMRKFHPEHFVCSYCLRILNKGTFKEREDKPYCQECFYRLFG